MTSIELDQQLAELLNEAAPTTEWVDPLEQKRPSSSLVAELGTAAFGGLYHQAHDAHQPAA
jgi:hypothetical protein